MYVLTLMDISFLGITIKRLKFPKACLFIEYAYIKNSLKTPCTPATGS